MADSNNPGTISPQQVGMLMLRLKSSNIRKEMGSVSQKNPAQAQAALQKVVTRNFKLQKWMRVAKVDPQQLERIIRHGK